MAVTSTQPASIQWNDSNRCASTLISWLLQALQCK